ncbi:prenyltransferase/squalene oxidase repeat-containing protein [Paenibacillus marinisediminis]
MKWYQNAIRYIETHGNNIERARLKYIAQDHPISEQELADFFNNQRSDGGWAPFWDVNYSSLDASCFKLAQLEQTGVVSCPIIDETISFMELRQSPDGSFEEDRSVGDRCPPWAAPGNLQAQLYLTANCSFWISRYRPQSVYAERGALYIRDRLNNEGYLSSYMHTNWLSAGLFKLIGWEEEAGLLTDYMSKVIHELSADQLAWMASTMIIAGFPPDDLLLHRAVDLLISMQAESGYWDSADGEWHRVHASIEALRAIQYVLPADHPMYIR